MISMHVPNKMTIVLQHAPTEKKHFNTGVSGWNVFGNVHQGRSQTKCFGPEICATFQIAGMSTKLELALCLLCPASLESFPNEGRGATTSPAFAIPQEADDFSIPHVCPKKMEVYDN